MATRPSDKYNDTETQVETPPATDKTPADSRGGAVPFPDLTKGSRWHATDHTASKKKKGNR